MNSNLLTNYSLVIFDLDGTLAQSKGSIDAEMTDLLLKLMNKVKVAVISGGGYQQFQSQLIERLPAPSNILSNLLILPTSGSTLYTWNNGWNKQYSEQLSPDEKGLIISALKESLKKAGFKMPDKIFGEQIEDRESQISFSALGQEAPIELKSVWDPDRTKRQKIIEILSKKLEKFDVRIGGTTTIDITKRGVNKAFGIHKLENYLNIDISKIVFVGDALFQGGNDFPAKTTGVNCIQVEGPDKTKKLISNWLENL